MDIDEPTLSQRAADAIRRELGSRDWSKSELARRLGVSHTWVTNRLARQQEISLNDLQRIAEALEVDVADLLPKPAGRGVNRPSAPMPDRTADVHLTGARHSTGRSTHITTSRTSDARESRPSWMRTGVTR